MRSLLARVIPFPQVRFGGSSRLGKGPYVEPLALARDMILTEMADRSTAGLTLFFEARVKSHLSTWHKMVRKGLQLRRLYDIRGLRVIVDNEGDTRETDARAVCYALRDAILHLWEDEASERDDYILNPKESGYQALHLVVYGPEHVPMEIQIRTRHMHEYAEYGSGAHWLYKSKPSGAQSTTVFAPRTVQEG